MIRPVIATAALALVAGCGSSDPAPAQAAKLEAARVATIKYRDRNVALADGYRPLPSCVESPEGDGALGIEYLHLRRSRDHVIELAQPEQLFYERKSDGSLTLMGVGYFVPDEGQRAPDSPLGHLDGPIPGQYFGQSPHYELHAWVHSENPDGVLAFFHPELDCDE